MTRVGKIFALTIFITVGALVSLRAVEPDTSPVTRFLETGGSYYQIYSPKRWLNVAQSELMEMAVAASKLPEERRANVNFLIGLSHLATSFLELDSCEIAGSSSIAIGEYNQKTLYRNKSAYLLKPKSFPRRLLMEKPCNYNEYFSNSPDVNLVIVLSCDPDVLLEQLKKARNFMDVANAMCSDLANVTFSELVSRLYGQIFVLMNWSTGNLFTRIVVPDIDGANTKALTQIFATIEQDKFVQSLEVHREGIAAYIDIGRGARVFFDQCDRLRDNSTYTAFHRHFEALSGNCACWLRTSNGCLIFATEYKGDVLVKTEISDMDLNVSDAQTKFEVVRTIGTLGIGELILDLISPDGGTNQEMPPTPKVKPKETENPPSETNPNDATKTVNPPKSAAKKTPRSSRVYAPEVENTKVAYDINSDPEIRKLNDLGKHVWNFAQNHGGRFPTDAEAEKYMGGALAYCVYFSGFTTESNPHLPLLIEKRENPRAGFHVLYCNCEADFIPLERSYWVPRAVGELHSKYHYDNEDFEKLLKKALTVDEK